MTARQIVRWVTDRIHGDTGCSSGECVFGHPGGPTTQGGCRCARETDPAVLRRMLFRMAEVARAMATAPGLCAPGPAEKKAEYDAGYTAGYDDGYDAGRAAEEP